MFKTIIFILLTTVFSNAAVAKMYKCKVKGKTTYQARPCKNTEQGEFSLRSDISKAKKRQAALDYQKLLIERKEAQRIAYEEYDRERLIRAEERKAYASENAAHESRRQANALEQRNTLEAAKRLY